MANKLKMRGLIESYDMNTGRGTFQLLSDYREAFAILYQRVKGAVWELTAGKWYKKRTTGYRSQSAHFHGHCQTICEDTGNDMNDVKLFLKRRAVRRGYPLQKTETGDIRLSIVDGEPLPQSESEADTIQEGYLIEEAHQLAAEYSVFLIEYDD